ncbi:MAG: DNA pilot protein [Microviridae sp.]|nr:MAG: DNA pilot protein [Microviridae sp.]
MATDWLSIGLGATDVIGNQIQAGQQYRRQKKLMDIQQQNQMELNKQGQQIQLETWKETNYPAQMEMLKKAGLNPSLMYAKGGTPGTTGGQGGGSAASGNAQSAAPMEISNIMNMRAQQAQIKLTEAQAEKTKVETEKIGGVDTTKAESEIGKIIAETQNEQIKGELMKVQTAVETIKMNNEQNVIEANLRKIAEETNKLRLENKITQETTDSIIKEAAANAIGSVLSNELTKSNTKLSQEQIEKIRTELYNDWTRIQQTTKGLEQKDKEIAIQKFRAEFEARWVGTGKVVGKIFKNVVDVLDNMKGATVGTVHSDKVQY